MGTDNLPSQNEEAAEVMQEYRRDLENILVMCLGQFISHATGDLHQPYCVLTEDYQSLVTVKVDKFLHEIIPILSTANCIPRGYDLPRRPEDIDISGLLSGFNKGARS